MKESIKHPIHGLKRIIWKIKEKYYGYKFDKFNFGSPELNHIVDVDRKKAIDILWWKLYHKTFPWNNPQTLNEKITFLSGTTDTSLWSKLSDKYEVRKHVENLGLGHILIKCYGVWDKVEDVDFAALPNSFVLKCTHDSGSTIIIRDKVNELDIPKVTQFLNEHLSKLYGYNWIEPHYNKITPRIMAEELLPNLEETPPPDYKFLCINGKVQNCMVCYERNIGIGCNCHAIKDIYAVKPWQQISEVVTTEHLKDSYKISIPKPDNLDLMIKYAETLSEGFEIIRVDFFNIGGTIYFGELTFTPEGGRIPYINNLWQTKYGEMIQLKK